jgi:hypothetical protein
MASETDQLQFDVRPQSGSCFTIDGNRVYDPANPVAGTLAFNVNNKAGKWIDVVVEGQYPSWNRLWTSGRMEDGQSDSLSTQLQFYTGWTIHITRWAPGAFGIPGNGGGEAFFILPASGDVTVNITVTS